MSMDENSINAGCAHPIARGCGSRQHEYALCEYALWECALAAWWLRGLREPVRFSQHLPGTDAESDPDRAVPSFETERKVKLRRRIYYSITFGEENQQ